MSLFCASTGGLSRRYLKTNQKVDLNSPLFLKGHLQVGLISICKCYGFISGMRSTNYFRPRNHCRQEIMSDPRYFCSPTHPPPLRPTLSHPTLCLWRSIFQEWISEEWISEAVRQWSIPERWANCNAKRWANCRRICKRWAMLVHGTNTFLMSNVEALDLSWD